jgi:hypothetical protein
MSFLAPGWVLLAVAASAVVAAIHLIAWQLPRAVPLPTARFVPDEPARRAARTIRPSDLGLLALRIATLMAAGLALAKPVVRPAPSGTASVIVMQRYADTTGLRDSIALLPRGERTRFVVFDTSARVFGDESAALSAGTDSVSGASLSVGLLSGIREAKALARDYDRVNIAVVSTFERGAFDGATLDVRASWPDSIRIVRRPLLNSIGAVTPIEIVGDGDDPVVAGIRLAEANELVHGSARVTRGAATSLTASDSAFANTGGAVIVWPRNAEAEDRIDGVHATDATAVGHFVPLPLADSGRVVARWVDGRAAVTETAIGAGCFRTVGFDVADVGDLALTPGFQRLAAELLAPCAGNGVAQVASDSLIAAIANPPAEVLSVQVPDESGAPNRLAATLMALAVLLALAEFIIRHRSLSRRTLEVAT